VEGPGANHDRTCPHRMSSGSTRHLTRWLLEISPGVFVGHVPARVRDALWDRVIEMCRDGRAILVYTVPEAKQSRSDLNTPARVEFSCAAPQSFETLDRVHSYLVTAPASVVVGWCIPRLCGGEPIPIATEAVLYQHFTLMRVSPDVIHPPVTARPITPEKSTWPSSATYPSPSQPSHQRPFSSSRSLHRHPHRPAHRVIHHCCPPPQQYVHR